MPHISVLRESKFLKKEDCGAGILVTIRDVQEQDVGTEDHAEKKWCIIFEENVKPMVLNSTNAQIIAVVCGSEDTDDWGGHKIVLYADPNVSYQGKLIGGIRARAPKQNKAPARPAPKPAAATVTEPEFDEEGPGNPPF